MALGEVDAETTDCWGRILESELPTILFCASADTSDLRTTRQELDRVLLDHDGIVGASGRWAWRNHREYFARTFDTASGPLEARIYYTKNLIGIGYVVTLTAPPLRDRPDDILPLAGHFLERFALQYEKGVRRFSPEAENLLLSQGKPAGLPSFRLALATAEAARSCHSHPST